ncbi:MAG TPA: 3'(2'),5'-bisphosphate nucleotidase CysQ [Bacillales bacterium]|nr:3'(2'),5'-bisphosphate nucleotidase CysQ [Bacillales bacterium]
MLEHIQLVDLIQISQKAGDEIVKVYESDFSVETKEDDSPITLADQKSHDVISRGLKQLYPDIPILSEEGRDMPFETRKSWQSFWLVDPLDGTKEFVKRNGEFTTNIALIQDGKPVLGVIYAPMLACMYVAKKGEGSFKISDVKNKSFSDDTTVLNEAVKLPATQNQDQHTVIASRSHMSEETEQYVAQLKKEHQNVQLLSAGSSLKLCLVAEGKADVYPRFAPTMEWDTAAGQAIVEQSGGVVYMADENQPLDYNKQNLRNPWFIAKRALN